MSTKQPANPRRMRVSRRAKDHAYDGPEVLASDGLRIRLRLSPADSALLASLRGDDEDASATIRRLIRTAGLFSTVTRQMDEIAESLALIESRGLAPVPTPTDAESCGTEDTVPDPVTLQKAAIAGFLADDDDEEE